MLVGGVWLVWFVLGRLRGSSASFDGVWPIALSWMVGFPAAGIAIALLAPFAHTILRRYASYAFGGIILGVVQWLALQLMPVPMDAEDGLVLALFGVGLGCAVCYIVDRYNAQSGAHRA
jgi:hypothetical protein